MNKKYTHQGTLYWIFTGGFVAVFSAALIYLALLATHMRLSGDDYCYNAILVRDGFWGMQLESYLRVWMYNGNRYAHNFFSGLGALSPRWGSGLLSVFSLLLLLAGLTWLLCWITERLHIKLTRLENFLLSEVFVTFLLWSAPTLTQNFFWRSATVPYFLALTGMSWLIVFVIQTAESQGCKWAKYFGLFLLAVVVGGFSETATALQGGIFGILLVAIVFSLLFSEKRFKKYLPPVIIVLIGTVISIALLFFSPVTAIRRANLPDPINLESLRSLLWLNLKVYIHQALIRRTLTVTVPFVFGFSATLIYAQQHREQPGGGVLNLSWKHIFLALILLGVSVLLLISAVLLPGTYTFSDYPPQRALILSQAVLIGGCILAGVLIASLFDSIVSNFEIRAGWIRNIARALSLLLLVFVLIAPIMLLNSNLGKWRIYRKWSSMWDERHEILYQAGRSNVDEIHVVELDSIIHEVGELSANPDYWYNNCAEMYYGIKAIYADQPGW